MVRRIPWAEKASVNEYGFITDFAYPYPLTYTEYRKWRTHVPSASTCEIPDCKYVGSKYVYDHCHWHNYIRGQLCWDHNVWDFHYLSRVETDWQKNWILRCPECSAIIDEKKPQSPGEWRNALLPDIWDASFPEYATIADIRDSVLRKFNGKPPKVRYY